MTVESPSSVVVPSCFVESSSPPLVLDVDPAFEERWVAWRCRGLRHDLVVRRMMRIVVLIAAIILGVIAALAITGGSL